MNSEKYLDPKIYDLLFDWTFHQERLLANNCQELIERFPYE